MTMRMLLQSLLTFVLGLALAGIVPTISSANFGSPRPKVDCTKSKNKNKPECKASRSEAADDEVYNAVYWLARSEKYAEALTVLKQAKNPDTPRLLNETGYITRKMGDIDGALVYYRRALALDPNYVFARAYMGEALLIKGDMAAAKSELSEIEKRCGTSCTAYVHLAGRITKAAGGTISGG